MNSRAAWWTFFAGAAGLAVGLFGLTALGGAAPAAVRISFQIATGSTGGTYFPVGEVLAGIISHPPGVSRCAPDGVCGPDGLIASARATEGAVANVRAVDSGWMESGLAQSDVIADAAHGRGVFKKSGPLSHLRTIADLFPEDVHLLVRAKASIAHIGDLAGKRVSLGSENSGTLVTAREILSAYRISEKRTKPSYESADVAAQRLEKGDIDAMFFIGGAPVPLVEELLSRGVARLVPIDGDGRKRLVAKIAELHSTVIAPGTYPRTGRIDTVNVRAIWVVNAGVPDSVVYGVTRALFNPANRSMLDEGHRSAQLIKPDTAAADLPIALHPGAARYYREIGKLPGRGVPQQAVHGAR